MNKLIKHVSLFVNEVGLVSGTGRLESIDFVVNIMHMGFYPLVV